MPWGIKWLHKCKNAGSAAPPPLFAKRRAVTRWVSMCHFREYGLFQQNQCRDLTLLSLVAEETSSNSEEFQARGPSHPVETAPDCSDVPAVHSDAAERNHRANALAGRFALCRRHSEFLSLNPTGHRSPRCVSVVDSTAVFWWSRASMFSRGEFVVVDQVRPTLISQESLLKR